MTSSFHILSDSLFINLASQSYKNVDLYIHSPIRLHGVVLN
jgi:hypothetical protein